MMPWRDTGPGVLWVFRRTGVWVFLTLLLIATGERRLADFDYNLHWLSLLDVGFYDEAIEGDEVTLRLVAVDDASPPTVAAPSSPLAPLCAVPICADVSPRPIELPAPRGPPSPPSALV